MKLNNIINDFEPTVFASLLIIAWFALMIISINQINYWFGG